MKKTLSCIIKEYPELLVEVKKTSPFLFWKKKKGTSSYSIRKGKREQAARMGRNQGQTNQKLAYVDLLLGLLAVVVILHSYFHVFLSESKESSLFAQVYSNVTRRIEDGLITLTIKFLHFLISVSLQFRYVQPLQQQQSFSTSMLFWVSLTRSVSSMYGQCLVIFSNTSN